MKVLLSTMAALAMVLAVSAAEKKKQAPLHTAKAGDFEAGWVRLGAVRPFLLF